MNRSKRLLVNRTDVVNRLTHMISDDTGFCYTHPVKILFFMLPLTKINIKTLKFTKKPIIINMKLFEIQNKFYYLEPKNLY